MNGDNTGGTDRKRRLTQVSPYWANSCVELVTAGDITAIAEGVRRRASRRWRSRTRTRLALESSNEHWN